MKFSVDLGIFNSIFAVPSFVVDEHIKFASSAQIKVLLFLLRHASSKISPKDIEKELFIPSSEARDAMLYWVENKIILREKDKKEEDDVRNKLKIISNKKVETKEKILKSSTLKPTKPDSSSVAKRIKEDKDIAFLMEEAEVILSRTISNADSSSLLMFHDTEGLPVCVITMMLQYCASIGKRNMRYIEKVAMSWAMLEIDTIEKADKKIRSLEAANKAWRILQEIIGVDKRSPTPKEEEAANRWINQWKVKEELITEAYNMCVDAKGKYILGYMNTVIKSWHSSSIKTLKQAVDAKNKRYTKNTRRKPSYDISKYKDFSVF